MKRDDLVDVFAKRPVALAYRSFDRILGTEGTSMSRRFAISTAVLLSLAAVVRGDVIDHPITGNTSVERTKG